MNYYEILEIHPKASKEVVKAAYKSLMQRYHPDKNPGNPEAARHATLIAQAYGIISDENQRSIYDIQLKEQAGKAHSRSPEKHPAQRLRKIPKNQPIAEKNNAMYAWLLISVIFLSGVVLLFLTKEKPPQPLPQTQPHLNAQTEREAPAVKQDPADLERPSLPPEPSLHPAGPLSKTLQLSSKVMTIRLKDTEQREHVLSIPLLFIKVGSYDSEKFIRDIERRKDAINRQLMDRLAYASYEELASKDEGEKYLKKTILDALGRITETNRFEEYPAAGLESPGRYGVVDIIFLEPFSLQ